MKDYFERMTPEQAQTFKDDVLNIVAQIPRGRVTTYGHIAAPGAEKVPCHRVVNATGRTAPGWAVHREMLLAEGVTFKANGRVDMERHLWEPKIG